MKQVKELQGKCASLVKGQPCGRVANYVAVDTSGKRTYLCGRHKGRVRSIKWFPQYAQLCLVTDLPPLSEPPTPPAGGC